MKWSDKMRSPEFANHEIMLAIPIYLAWYTQVYRHDEKERKVEELTSTKTLEAYAKMLAEGVYS